MRPEPVDFPRFFRPALGINRTTGSYIIFADLFDEKHYTVLEELIMTQMRNQLAQSENIT